MGWSSDASGPATLGEYVRDVLPIVGSAALQAGIVTANSKLGAVGSSLLSLGIEVTANERFPGRNGALETLISRVDKFLLTCISSSETVKHGKFWALDSLRARKLTPARLQAAFAAARRMSRTQCDDIIKLVSACSEQTDEESLDMEGEETTKPGFPSDAPRYVMDNTYRVLHKHMTCTCRYVDGISKAAEHGRCHHCAKLRLRGRTEAANVEHKMNEIDMLFSSRPDPPLTSWRKVQVATSMKAKRKNKVTHIPQSPHGLQTPPDTPSTHHLDSPHLEHVLPASSLEEGDFCFHLGKGHDRMPLRLKVSQEKLRLAPQDVPNLETGTISSASCNLSDIMELYSMTFKMRLILGYLVAKAVWQYYNSLWMNAVWTRKRIHFLREMMADGKDAVYCKPYLDVEFEESQIGSLEHRSPVSTTGQEHVTQVPHQYPIVLSLGTMLLEIGEGKLLQKDLPQHWDPRTINLTYAKGFTTINNPQWAKGWEYPRYKRAVEKCFDISLFSAAPFLKDKPEAGLEERRAVLYNEVVYPLETLIEHMGLFDENEWHDIENTPFQRKTDSPQINSVAAPSKVAEEAKKPEIPTQPTNGISHLALTTFQPSIGETREWLECVEGINEYSICSEEYFAAPKLRIAVLGTGGIYSSLNTSHSDSDQVAWKDFVDTSEAMRDEDGSGTNLTTLFARLAPHASLHVARVMRKSQDVETSSQSVAQAIRHASKVWQVDYIVIPFGFRHPNQIVWKAINEIARRPNGGPIFFAAAASDDGSSKIELFPASLPSVLSIRGTDASGDFLVPLDPISKHSDVHLGAFASMVVSNKGTGPSLETISGCSVATVVAAGLSAMLHNHVASLPGFQASDLSSLRNRDFLIQLFKTIGGDAHKCCISADTFMSLSEEKQAQAIKDVIAALGKSHDAASKGWKGKHY